MSASATALGRRRVLLGLPALVMSAGLLGASAARADSSPQPPELRALERAALALFDATDAAPWPAVSQALDPLREAAKRAATLEIAYLDAGGQLGDFLATRDMLAADLIEAGAALAAANRRWLISAAERIVQVADRLSLPFDQAGYQLGPRLKDLLYLARSIRRALIWSDDAGQLAAQQDFSRLWRSVRVVLETAHPNEVKRLNVALDRLSQSHAAADARALSLSVEQLRV